MKTPKGVGKAVLRDQADPLQHARALNTNLRKVDSSITTIDLPGNIHILNGHASDLLHQLLAEHILLQRNPHLLAWQAQQQRIVDGQFQVTVAEQYVKRQEAHIAHIQKLMKTKDAPLRLSNKLGTFQDGLVVRDTALRKAQNELVLVHQNVERECESLSGPVQDVVRGFNEKIRDICRMCSELVREHAQRIKPKTASPLPSSSSPVPDRPKSTSVLATPVTPPVRKVRTPPVTRKKEKPPIYTGFGTATIGINIPLRFVKIMQK